MIRVRYSCDKPQRMIRIKVKGHAGAGPAGYDVVCGAVTILVRTIAKEVSQMHDVGLLARPPTVYTESGDAEICAVARDDLAYRDMKTKFETVRSGIELLCENFSDYVRFN